MDQIIETYRDREGRLFLERFLPPAAVEGVLLLEVERGRPPLLRNYLPNHKKGGRASYDTLEQKGPAILSFYRSPGVCVRPRDGALQAVRLQPEGRDRLFRVLGPAAKGPQGLAPSFFTTGSTGNTSIPLHN